MIKKTKIKMASDRVCKICKFGDTGVLENFEWMTVEDITIHLFCALLSPNLVKKDEDDNGMPSFMAKDIRDLIRRHKETKCVYCQNGGASVPCADEKCQRFFHVICGEKNDCLSTFNNNFQSFCDKHVKITEKFSFHGSLWKCQICYNPIGVYNQITSIPSCCSRFYHKKCMQKYAITAGRETKCPSCGCLDNDGNYQDYLRNRGIYCPDKKPDWEADGAYDDVERYTYKCVAETCRCPHGIHYEEDRGKWEVLCCYFCGDNCIHIECRSSSKNDKIFVCDVCSNTVKEKLEFTESDMLPLRNE